MYFYFQYVFVCLICLEGRTCVFVVDLLMIACEAHYQAERALQMTQLQLLHYGMCSAWQSKNEIKIILKKKIQIEIVSSNWQKNNAVFVVAHDPFYFTAVCSVYFTRICSVPAEERGKRNVRVYFKGKRQKKEPFGIKSFAWLPDYQPSQCHSAGDWVHLSDRQSGK